MAKKPRKLPSCVKRIKELEYLCDEVNLIDYSLKLFQPLERQLVWGDTDCLSFLYRCVIIIVLSDVQHLAALKLWERSHLERQSLM